MAESSLARGIIIIDNGFSQSTKDYSNYRQNSFLVFLINPDSVDWMGSQDQFVATITYKRTQPAKTELAVWTSSMNLKSQQLNLFLEKLFSDVPSMKDKVDYKPRYALKGFSGDDEFDQG